MTAFPDIHSLIPHAGTMCLLDSIVSFDDNSIVCRARSHRHSDNPLLHRGRLSAHAGIEYAAQAVAAHGTLLASRNGAPVSPRGGMIAVLSDVHWHTDRLDNIAADLDIQAEKLADLPQGLNYRFTVSAGETILVEGELIIALQNRDIP